MAPPNPAIAVLRLAIRISYVQLVNISNIHQQPVNVRYSHPLKNKEDPSRTMDEKTITNLRDAGCCDAFIDELSGLPSACARICRLKTYRRELLERIHAGQKRLEILDYLIYTLQEAIK